MHGAVAVVDQREVGERAADVDSDSVHAADPGARWIDQSSFAPDTCTTLRHLTISLPITLLKSACVLATVCAPWLSSNVLKLGELIAATSSLFRYSRIAGGV